MAIKKSDLYSSLWASCDELRGGMDASQYKDYVLFMLFIKYISDKYGDSDDFAPPVTIPKGASFKDMIALKGKSDIGDRINIGGKEFLVVGETSGQSLFAGIPLVYVPLEDAQAIAVLGQPLATTLLFDHIPTFVPRELKVLTNADVKGDVLRPLTAARSSIGFVRLLLWLVAAIVIGSVLYLQALERTRDFAVFKATGTSTAAIGAGLALQAVMLSLAAAVLAAILATVLAPLFPLHIDIPVSAYLMLPVITVVVGLLACSIALRRTARVDPALAFGG